MRNKDNSFSIHTLIGDLVSINKLLKKANKIVPDQTAPLGAPDLGLFCLHMSVSRLSINLHILMSFSAITALGV